MVRTHRLGNYIKKLNKILLAAALICVVCFNVVKVCRLAETNNRQIINYQSPVDELQDFRTPLPLELYFAENYDENKELKIAVLAVDERVFGKQAFKTLQKKLNIVQNGHGLLVFNHNNVDYVNKLTEKLQLHLQKIEYKELSDKISEQIKTHITTKNKYVLWILGMEELESKQAGLQIAKELNLRPRVINLNDKMPRVHKNKDIKVNNEDLSLEQQEENLRQFATDYEPQLARFLKNVFAGYYSMPKYSAMDEHLFDRGAVLTLAIDENNGKYQQFGDVYADTALARSLLNGFTLAKAEMPDAQYKFFILTRTNKKKYVIEDNFLEDIKTGNDGIMLVNGNRRALFLPYFWKIYPDKENFVKNLKISAGLSPDYWSKKIKVYYFRAVEIKYEN